MAFATVPSAPPFFAFPGILLLPNKNSSILPGVPMTMSAPSERNLDTAFEASGRVVPPPPPPMRSRGLRSVRREVESGEDISEEDDG